MSFHELAVLDVPRLSALVPLAIGLATTCVLLLVARVLLARRCVPSPASPQTLPADPFVACFAERRGPTRCPGQQVEVHVCGSAAAKAARGIVLDRSMDGLCLVISQAVSTGTVISVRRADEAHASPWVPFRVRYCRQQAKRYCVGGQFVGAPTLSGLLFA